MFRNPSLYRDNPAALYVFSYGYIADAHALDIQAALATKFPGGIMVAARPFETALEAASLQRIPVTQASSIAALSAGV